MTIEESNNLSAIHQLKNGSSFKAQPYYEPLGDCIFYFLQECATVAYSIDWFLVVYRTRKNNAIVGIQLKHISQLFDKIE